MNLQQKIDLSNVALDIAAKYDWINCAPFDIGRELEEALEFLDKMMLPKIIEAEQLAEGTDIGEAIRQLRTGEVVLESFDKPTFWRDVYLKMEQQIQEEEAKQV